MKGEYPCWILQPTGDASSRRRLAGRPYGRLKGLTQQQAELLVQVARVEEVGPTGLLKAGWSSAP